VLRLALAVVIFPHGAQKVFGWFGGNQKGEGFEFHLPALGIAIALILGGAGRWSIDALIVP
jgi:putative oxidoreductase